MFFKETSFQEVAFGEIPKDWQELPLIEAVGGNDELVVAGPFGSNLKVEDYREQGVPILRLQNIENCRFVNKDIKYVSPEKAEELKYHSFMKGDIVLAKLGQPIGKTCIVPLLLESGIVVADVVRIRIGAKSRLDKGYAMYALNSAYVSGQLKRETIGTTRPRVNLSQVRKLIVPFPSLSEQHQIAKVLGVVDSALELADRVIANTERIKKGLMQQLLTHGIGHTEYKETSIGKIPKEWETIELKEVVLSYKNGIYKPRQYAGKGCPCVRMYNIVAGKINLENAALLDVTEQEVEEFGLRPGDIVVNRVNTSELVGKAGVVPTGFAKATFESKNIRMRLDMKKISPEFLSVFVQTRAYSNQLLSRAKTAVAQATVTQEDLDSVVVPLPQTLDEQQKIVDIINTADKKIALETEEKRKLGKLSAD